ncbi:MAG: Glycosyltransferase [Cytophagales bacterium]|nr:glycosyltransferase [Bacteroidota bacterium]MBS1982400.1 glycosyltransferase [Bacteroidota bacterium]WHZ06666.1 MAG: Glycosyltransferase [Cytophagales bacterium]
MQLTQIITCLFYSFIIPAFNRPDEINELLASFTELNLPVSSFDGFEVIIADGSPSDILANIIAGFKNHLRVEHLHRPKLAISPSRNLGAAHAKGGYLIFLDSDVILPKDYLNHLHSFLLQNKTDAFGGPDAAHESFSDTQKAISFAMTSYLTTGGIRGGKKQLHTYNPRGFNMGVKKEIFQQMNGFSSMTCGEDIELSIRILEAGYSVLLIPDAFVYHKRRSTFKSFFRQVFRFGAARINIFCHHRKELKLTHFFPSAFLIFLIVGIIGSIISPIIFKIFISVIALYYGMILIFSSFQEKSLKVGLLSIIGATCQLCGYGSGFLANGFEVFVKGNKDGLNLGASK